MHEPGADPVPFWIDPLGGEPDLDGVLAVEAESFTNPWTRDMYAWELQNRSVCHIYVARTPDCPVAGFCAFWLVFDEIHINNVAIRPQYRGQGMGTAVMHHVLAEARRLGAKRATLEVRASNERGPPAVRAARVLCGRRAAQLLLESRRGRAHPVARRAADWLDVKLLCNLTLSDRSLGLSNLRRVC